ncbi:MAG: hypothetical protein TR69_WS6001001245 [candidate division WS6 bacterium OLB20]|uniref:Uncharacterized protein n=1 Tax=candidate division WS6 bacterium OLB20 TaxID=1617426 RepID=A0A136LX67_9BACT|nr:MAG: hypothetical protein TR69_WS6001001245 [candidate division WS6 bacterium OLB20]
MNVSAFRLFIRTATRFAFCFAVSFVFLSAAAHAAEAATQPYFWWARNITTDSYSEMYDVATAPDGSVYMIGWWDSSGAVDFDGTAGTDNRTDLNDFDGFLTKYNQDGTYEWTVTPTSSSFIEFKQLTTDSSGYAYVIGDYDGTVDFNPNGSAVNRTSSSDGQAFLAKYDPSDGSLVWIRTFGSTTGSNPINYNMRVDYDGTNIVLVSRADGNQSTGTTYDLDGTAGTDNQLLTGHSVIIVSYSTSGDYNWGRSITRASGSTYSSAEPADISIYDGSIYILGRVADLELGSTIDFDAGAGTDIYNPTGSSFDTFILKYSTSGVYESKVIFPFNLSNAAVDPKHINVNDTGIYFAGNASASIDLDPGAGTATFSPTSGSIDSFILLLNNSFVYQWSNKYGGTSNDYINALADNSAGDIYYAIESQSATIDMDPGAGTANTGSGLILSAIDSDGTYGGWTYNSSATGYAYRIHLSSDDHLYIAGVFYDGDDVDFSPESVVTPATGGGDAFVAAYSATPFTSVSGLPGGLTLTDTASLLDATSTSNIFSTSGRTLRLETSGGLVVADIPTDLTSERDWSTASISADSDDTLGKAYAHNITSAAGVGSNYTLYIPIPVIQSSPALVICPNATNLSEVTAGCGGAVTFADGQTQNVGADSVTVNIVSIGGQSYWQAAGVSGTGGISISSGFSLSDLMTRLQVSAASDHTLSFGNINNTDASGDTIVVYIDPDTQAFDLSSITVADIDLEDDGVDKTLAAAAGADTWGVSINTSLDTITFTAPTSGTDYISAGSVLVVKIGSTADSGSNQIVNPASVNSYELYIVITNSSGTETGEVEVPIIDDDTVNVSGYIDTFITFDIDTSDVDEDCDAAGGASPCDSHGGASDETGYVVDLGEMNTSSVNDSGDSVVHADGLSGTINSIFFDLSTNADGGAVVTARSLNGFMSGPGSNQIPSVADGSEVQITAGSSLYGINSFGGLVNSATTGSSTIHSDCDGTSGNDYYCDISTSASEIFNTSGNPIDSLRIQWEVAASPGSTNATGTYTDELTFIATATF